jgi:hypothetical protein
MRLVTELSSLRVVFPPKFVPGWAELVNESPVGGSCAHVGFENAITASAPMKNSFKRSESGARADGLADPWAGLI